MLNCGNQILNTIKNKYSEVSYSFRIEGFLKQDIKWRLKWQRSIFVFKFRNYFLKEGLAIHLYKVWLLWKIHLESKMALVSWQLASNPRCCRVKAITQLMEGCTFCQILRPVTKYGQDTRASVSETVDSNKNLFGLRIPQYFCQNFFRIAPQSNLFPPFNLLSLPLRHSRLASATPVWQISPTSSGCGLSFPTHLCSSLP